MGHAAPIVKRRLNGSAEATIILLVFRRVHFG